MEVTTKLLVRVHNPTARYAVHGIEGVINFLNLTFFIKIIRRFIAGVRGSKELITPEASMRFSSFIIIIAHCRFSVKYLIKIYAFIPLNLIIHGELMAVWISIRDGIKI